MTTKSFPVDPYRFSRIYRINNNLNTLPIAYIERHSILQTNVMRDKRSSVSESFDVIQQKLFGDWILDTFTHTYEQEIS